MLRFNLKYEITCITCFNDRSNEGSSSLLELAVSKSIQTALNSSLETETLSGENSIYCNFRCSLKSASVVPAFSEVGRYLAIQLKCLVSHDNQVIKDIKHVQCTPRQWSDVPKRLSSNSYHQSYWKLNQKSLYIIHKNTQFQIMASLQWSCCSEG